jgi:hypothetical protein
VIVRASGRLKRESGDDASAAWPTIPELPPQREASNDSLMPLCMSHGKAWIDEGFEPSLASPETGLQASTGQAAGLGLGVAEFKRGAALLPLSMTPTSPRGQARKGVFREIP